METRRTSMRIFWWIIGVELCYVPLLYLTGPSKSFYLEYALIGVLSLPIFIPRLAKALHTCSVFDLYIEGFGPPHDLRKQLNLRRNRRNRLLRSLMRLRLPTEWEQLTSGQMPKHNGSVLKEGYVYCTVPVDMAKSQLLDCMVYTEQRLEDRSQKIFYRDDWELEMIVSGYASYRLLVATIPKRAK